MSNVFVLNANPDPDPARSSARLADAYIEGALSAGHEVRRVDLGSVDFPPVITGLELETAAHPTIAQAHELLTWSEHLVIAFPLWLGGPPALLKSYFEQICRYDFAFDHDYTPLLTGRSVRILVSSVISAEEFAAGDGLGVQAFERGALRPCGFEPAEVTLVGRVDVSGASGDATRLRDLGAAAR